MDITDILTGLNDPQREAVTSEAAHLLVLAGAGSGKTRVLAHRIAWAVKGLGVSPYSILAVTFTNKAAAEMRHRIFDLLDHPPQGMWIGTFHGIAHRLLKTHWQEAGLSENFQILDSEDQLRMIKRCLAELELDDKKWQPKSAQFFINDQKDEGLRAEQVQVGNDPFKKGYLKVYHHYEELCLRRGLVDFAELLLRAYELWKKAPSLLAHYQNRFQHVLIDEFQDTNTIQYAWIKLLANKTTQLTLVGDDDQSIYGWRGAKVENIHNVEVDFNPCQIIRLEQNYRSTQTILNAANGLIQNNHDRLGKKLWTAGDEGDLISVYSAYNEIDEARFVVDRIAAIKEDQVAYRDIAILYRSNAQSRVLEEALIRADVPYRIYGGLRFFERAEIKNAMAYMRLMHAETDDSAFERVVNLPTRGIGDRTLEKVRAFAKSEQLSLFSAAEKMSLEKQLPARPANALLKFIDLIRILKKETQELLLWQLVDEVLKTSGLLEFHQNEKGEKAKARVENLKELITAAKFFEAEDEEHPLAEFLGYAALESGDSQADKDQDCVQLMTLHSAKGLEFPFVFLVGLEEGLFPSQMSLEEPGRLEEERRLCYVGITRAMQKLIISHAESRRIYGDERNASLSRFVREIPPELLESVRINATVSRPLTADSKSGYVDLEESEFYPGQRVFHNIFGEGTILQIEGGGAHQRIEIKFDDRSVKWLMASYAKLSPIETAL